MTTPLEEIDPYRADCERCVGLCCVVMTHAPSSGFPETKPANQRCRNLSAENRCMIFDRLEVEGYTVCRDYDCFGAGPMVSTWIAADNAAVANRYTEPNPRRLEDFRALSRLRMLASMARDAAGETAEPIKDLFDSLHGAGERYRRDGVVNLDGATREVLRDNRNWIEHILSRIGR